MRHLIAAGITALCVYSLPAQAQNPKQVWVSLGNIATYTMVNNKPVPASTSCEAIIANAALVVKTPGEGCGVTGFTFAISSAKDSVIKGPLQVWGAELSDTAKKLLKAYAGTSGKVMIEHIKVGCDDGVKTGKPIVLRFEQ